MKRRKLFILSAAIVLIFLCGILSVGAFNPTDKLNEKYNGGTITEITETLRTMDYREIGNEANSIASAIDNSNSLWAHIIHIKTKTFRTFIT